jgi:Transcription factor WhiB
MDHLAAHPDLTVHEICVELGFMRQVGRGCTGGVLYLLRRMEQQGLVVVRTEFRASQGRQVRLWRTAPPGTVPPQRGESRAAAVRRRERARMSKRRERARARGVAVPAGAHVAAMWPRLPVAVAWTLPPDAACHGADPELFFPEPGKPDHQAKAICAVCPVRAECLATALANGERYGVWGGVNLETREHCTGGVS